MILQLTDTHQLTSDKHCYKLCKKSVNKDGEVSYQSYRYYGTLANALKSVPEQLLKESDAIGLPEVLRTLRSIEHQLLTKIGEKPE